MLEHGGKVRQAAARYGIPLEDWLDFSTGVNPNGWSVPEIPSACWTRLPEDDDGLEQAARSYYGAEHLLPVAGSQAAIQGILTRLFIESSRLRFGLPGNEADWTRLEAALSGLTVRHPAEAVL